MSTKSPDEKHVLYLVTTAEITTALDKLAEANGGCSRSAAARQALAVGLAALTEQPEAAPRKSRGPAIPGKSFLSGRYILRARPSKRPPGSEGK